jgi:hypothetical protein
MGGVGVVDAPVAGSSTLLDDIWGFWKLDETSGSTCVDSSGNGYDGTINGATINQTGHIDKCYSFDNSADDNVTINDAPTIGTGDYSFACWFKTTSTSLYRCFFAFADYDPGFYLDGGNQINVYDSGDITSPTFSDVADDVWHHVAIVRSSTGTNGVTCYIDGSSVGTLTHSASVSGTAVYIAASGYSGETFDGELDDVRFYERALTSSEVQQLANM